jgi:cell division protein FtsB
VASLVALVERLLPALILVLAVIGAPLLMFSTQGLPKLRALDQELAEVRRENDQERRKIAFLRQTVRRLKDDPAAVERIARDELGLVRKDEVVLLLPRGR